MRHSRHWRNLRLPFYAAFLCGFVPRCLCEGGIRLLLVVGLGHRLAGQITVESLNGIQKADKVLFSSYRVSEAWLETLNPNCESLDELYEPGKDRLTTYEEMVERILFYVRQGLNVCVAFYGHPGVCAYPGHEAIRRARQEGFQARMLPGVSAHDLLIADLGVDPALGCQSYEATDFLIRNRTPDPTCGLILWQLGRVGIADEPETDDEINLEAVRLLADVLTETYSPDHEVTVYEASPYPAREPLIQPVRLRGLPAARISLSSTLYVPPARAAVIKPEMLSKVRALAKTPSRRGRAP